MKDRKSLLILVIVLLVACSIAVVTSIAESADISMGGGIGLAPDGIASYTRLVGDAEDSPVVDDVGNANQFFSGLIIVYNFGGQ